MPTFQNRDGKPIVQFDPASEVSPFTLLRRLGGDRPPILLDGRRTPGSGLTLEGALPYPAEDWRPDEPDRDIVVFDDDGSEAAELVRALRSRGLERARMLFGGLELYRFSLDPEIVGKRTFLVSGDDGST